MHVKHCHFSSWDEEECNIILPVTHLRGGVTEHPLLFFYSDTVKPPLSGLPTNGHLLLPGSYQDDLVLLN